MGIQAPAEVKFSLIHESVNNDDNMLNISHMCEIAGVSRSGYYAWMAAAPAREAREKADIRDFDLILDAYTHEMLAYKVSSSFDKEFVLQTVDQLVEEHGCTLDNTTICNSDQGCHYTSYAFINKLKGLKIRQSMSRKGNCWDNAPQESFYGHMKDEIAEEIKSCTSYIEVLKVVDDWMDYYNNDRYQWSLLKLSPTEYYQYKTTGTYPLLLHPNANIKEE